MNTTLEKSTGFLASELPADIRDKVAERHRDWNTDGIDWWDGVCDTWKEKLEALGYSNPDIEFSGFWSQGDGASFTADSVPAPTEENAPEVWGAWLQFKAAVDLTGGDGADDLMDGPVDCFSGRVIRTDHHYRHENTVRAVCILSGEDGEAWECLEINEACSRFYEALEDWGNSLTETVRDLCREIYADLEKEYEWLTSDEQVLESLDANEMLFDEEGEEI